MEETPSQTHNRLAKEIVNKILTEGFLRQMRSTDVLVLLESILAGTLVGVVKLGGDEIVLEHLMKNTERRIKALRVLMPDALKVRRDD